MSPASTSPVAIGVPPATLAKLLIGLSTLQRGVEGIRRGGVDEAAQEALRGKAREVIAALTEVTGGRSRTFNASSLHSALDRDLHKGLNAVIREVRSLGIPLAARFGVVPDFPIAAENLEATRDFIRSRLERTAGIVARLDKMAQSARAFRDHLPTEYQDLLVQIERVGREQEELVGTSKHLDEGGAAALSRRTLSHYIHVRLLESLALTQDQLAKVLRSGAVNGLWSDPETTAGLVRAPWVQTHQDLIKDMFGRLTPPNQAVARLLLEDYESMCRFKAGEPSSSITEQAFDAQVFAAAVAKREAAFFGEEVLPAVLDFVADYWGQRPPLLAELVGEIATARADRQRHLALNPPLFPDQARVVPAQAYETLSDYLARFGVDLRHMDADTEAREEFRYVVGVTPRTVMTWGRADGEEADSVRPRKMGCLIALYRLAVEVSWQQQVLYHRQTPNESPIDVPDPLDILRLAFGSWANPLFAKTEQGTTTTLIVEMPPEVADHSLEALSYHTALSQILEHFNQLPEAAVAHLRREFPGVITGDTLRKHIEGRIEARSRLGGRGTARLLLGDALDVYFESISFIRATRVSVSDESGREIGAPHRSCYRLKLISGEGVGANLAAMTPHVRLDEAPFCFFDDGTVLEFLRATTQHIDFLCQVCGWEEGTPLFAGGQRIQTVSGLREILRQLAQEVRETQGMLGEWRIDPSRIRVSSYARVEDLVRRVLRLHYFLLSIPVVGQLRLGEYVIDYRCRSLDAAESGQSVLHADPQRSGAFEAHLATTYLREGLASGEIEPETAQRILQFRLYRMALAAEGFDLDSPSLDRALAYRLFAGLEGGEYDSILQETRRWEEAEILAETGGLLNHAWVRRFLERLAEAPSYRPLRSTQEQALTRAIQQYFLDRYGVPTESVDPLVQGFADYIGLHPAYRESFDSVSFTQALSGIPTGALICLAGTDSEGVTRAIFTDLLAAMGLPHKEPEASVSPSSPPPPLPPPAEVSTTGPEGPKGPVKGLLQDQIRCFLETRFGTVTDGDVLLILCVVRHYESTLLQGKTPDGTEVAAKSVDEAKAVQDIYGLALDPQRAVQFIEHLTQLLQQVTAHNFPTTKTALQEPVLALIRQMLCAPEVEAPPRELAQWLEGMKATIRREEGELATLATSLRDNTLIRDQAGYWRSLVSATERLAWLPKPMAWSSVLERHESRMVLLLPTHRSQVRPLVEMRLASLPETYRPEDDVPELAPLSGRYSLVRTHLLHRYGLEGDEGAGSVLNGIRNRWREALGRDEIPRLEALMAEGVDPKYRSLAEGFLGLVAAIRNLPITEKETASQTVLRRLRVARALDDEVTGVAQIGLGQRILAGVQTHDRNATPDSNIFRAAQAAVDRERSRDFSGPFREVLELLDLETAGRPAELDSPEQWYDHLKAVAGEYGVVVPPRAGWEAHLTQLEVMALLAGRSDSMVLRQRVEATLASFVKKEDPPPPLAKPVWPVRQYNLVSETQFSTFWNEVVAQVERMTGDPDENIHLVVYLDEGQPRAVAVAKTTFDELLRERMNPTTTGGYLRGHRVVGVDGSERTLNHLQIRFMIGIPRAIVLSFGQWVAGLNPNDPSYQDIQLLMALAIHLRGLDPVADPFLQSLDVTTTPTELRESLNRFYQTHKALLEMSFGVYRHLGIHYVSASLKQRLEEETRATGASSVITEKILALLAEHQELPDWLVSGIREALIAYEGAGDLPGLYARMIPLWSRVKGYFFGKNRELDLVSPFEVQDQHEVISDGLARLPEDRRREWKAFYHVCLEILAETPPREAARALVRLLHSPVIRKGPPYIYALQKEITESTPPAEREKVILRLYRRYRSEIWWRHHEVTDETWTRLLTPDEVDMPPKFRFVADFPELGELSYHELDRHKADVLATIHHPNGYIAVELDDRGLLDKVILPGTCAVTMEREVELDDDHGLLIKRGLGKILVAKLIVGVKNPDRPRERVIFHEVVRRNFPECPEDRTRGLPELQLTDVRGVSRRLSPGDKVITSFLSHDEPAGDIETAACRRYAKVYNDERLRDIHPLLLLIFGTSLSSQSADPDLEGGHLRNTRPLQDAIDALPVSLAARTPEQITRLIRFAVEAYRRHRPHLKRQGLHDRFARHMPD